MQVVNDATLFAEGRKGERGGGGGGIKVKDDVEEGEDIGEDISLGLMGGVMGLSVCRGVAGKEGCWINLPMRRERRSEVLGVT